MIWALESIADYPNDLWRDWDRLNALYCDSHPLLDSRFVKLLIAYFPSEIRVLIGSQNDRTTSLLLLEASKGLIQTSYQPSQAPLALLLHPQDLRDFCPFGKNALGFPVSRLDLIAVDSQYNSGYLDRPNTEVQCRGTNIALSVNSEFSEYWSKRSKKLRQNISRYRNRLSKELGKYELRITTDPTEVEFAVARYGFIESRGWKGKSGTALHPGNVQGNFYSELLMQFASTGEAYVFELCAGDLVLASRLCIHNNHTLIMIKTTFEEDYKKYAPGRILLFEVIRYIFENRCAHVIDFYTNASKDQLNWATESRPIYNISIYGGPSGSLLHKLVRARQFLTTRLNKPSQ